MKFMTDKIHECRIKDTAGVNEPDVANPETLGDVRKPIVRLRYNLERIHEIRIDSWDKFILSKVAKVNSLKAWVDFFVTTASTDQGKNPKNPLPFRSYDKVYTIIDTEATLDKADMSSRGKELVSGTGLQRFNNALKSVIADMGSGPYGKDRAERHWRVLHALADGRQKLEGAKPCAA